MAAKPITLANSKAKKEQRFAAIVLDEPIEAAEVSKLLPAEPTRTSKATACGI